MSSVADVTYKMREVWDFQCLETTYCYQQATAVCLVRCYWLFSCPLALVVKRLLVFVAMTLVIVLHYETFFLESYGFYTITFPGTRQRQIFVTLHCVKRMNSRSGSLEWCYSFLSVIGQMIICWESFRVNTVFHERLPSTTFTVF